MYNYKNQYPYWSTSSDRMYRTEVIFNYIRIITIIILLILHGGIIKSTIISNIIIIKEIIIQHITIIN